ncbi:hypothetical protein [Streptomyces sp. NPDC001205]
MRRVLKAAGFEHLDQDAEGLGLTAEHGAVLLAWQPDELLRPGDQLHRPGPSHSRHPEQAGIRHALYMAVVEVLVPAGYEVVVQDDGRLRITRGSG